MYKLTDTHLSPGGTVGATSCLATQHQQKTGPFPSSAGRRKRVKGGGGRCTGGEKTRQIGSDEIRAQGLLQLMNYSARLHMHRELGDPS